MKSPIIFSYAKSGISDSSFEFYSKALKPYIKHLRDVAKSKEYIELESSIALPGDKKLFEDIVKAVKKINTKELKYILIIGIGGSNLGTKAVYDALYGAYDVFDTTRFPKMLFVDTNDPENLEKMAKFISDGVSSLDELVVNVLSKSGGTTEVVANAEYILSSLIKKFGEEVYNRVVITTDEGSPLWNVAKKRDCMLLSIPKMVGGRYSVLSAVGLFPLALAGIDIKELRKGAMEAREMSLATNIAENPAVQSATVLMHYYKEGKPIHDTFIFHPELESIGKWYRQLMGESIGKEKDISGKVVHAGITPRSSIGSTDLHSVGQLYLGGPRDKITTFVRAETEMSGPYVPEERLFPELVPQITGKSMKQIMRAIYEGTKIAYTKNELPYMEITFCGINSYAIGGFLQFKMIEMMYLAALMEVNAFDQPNVESYKQETKKILMEE